MTDDTLHSRSAIVNKIETIPTADGSQVGERSAVAKCCLISARMLELADTDGHTNAQRASFRELNGKQAALLRKAAGIADDLLEALQQIIRYADDTTDPGIILAARRAIDKATGA